MKFYNVKIDTFTIQDQNNIESTAKFIKIKEIRMGDMPSIKEEKEESVESTVDQHAILFLATVDSQPVGTLRLLPRTQKQQLDVETGPGHFAKEVKVVISSIKDDKIAEISKWVVKKEYTESNIAFELVLAAIQKAMHLNCSLLITECLPQHTHYKMVGFSDMGAPHHRLISGQGSLVQLQYLYLGLENSRQRTYAIGHFKEHSDQLYDSLRYQPELLPYFSLLYSDKIPFDFGLGDKDHSIVYCAMDPFLHPQMHAIKECSMQWVVTYGIAEKGSKKFHAIQESNFSSLTARISEIIVDEDQLQIINDFLHYFFTHDNLIDSDKVELADVEKLNDQHSRLWSNKEIEEKLDDTAIPYTKAVLDLKKRLTKMDCNIDLFIESLKDYYGSTTRVFKLRLSQQKMSEEEVLQRRKDTGGVKQLFELVYALSRCSLPTKFSSLQKNLINEMHAAAEVAILLANDIASYQSENKHRNQMVYDNLLLYREKHHGETPRQAYNYALSKINSANSEFLKLKKILLDDLEKTLDSGLKSILNKRIIIMEGWIRGNFDWSKETPRYNPALRAPKVHAPKTRSSLVEQYKYGLAVASAGLIVFGLFRYYSGDNSTVSAPKVPLPYPKK